MQRLKPSVGIPVVKRKVSNAWTAVQDTFFSTKEVFERHRIVFTIGTSIASVGTACAGYYLRHLHQAKVEKRLDSIEKSMTEHHHVEEHVSYKAIAATAVVSFLMGYRFGWRGGKWYANRVFRNQQLKQQSKLQQPKLQGLLRLQHLKILKKPLLRLRTPSKIDDSKITHSSSASGQHIPLVVNKDISNA